MKLCIKITFFIGVQKEFLRSYVLKQAEKLGVEGVAQRIEDNKVVIIACGKKGMVDDFVDIIHKVSAKYKIDNIELQPFMGKDYRGVFRVIE